MKKSIKKILSVAMTAVLLVGMLAVGGVFVSAKEQTNNTNIFANFTTAARYSAFTATGAATSFSFAKMTPTYGYDGVNNAATFKTTGGYDTDPTRTAEFWLFLNGLSGVKVKGNETIVLKVKRSNTGMAPYATTAYVNGTPVDVTPTFTDAGEGWQYLTLTAASSAIIAKVGQNGYDTGEWTNIRIPFNGNTYNSGDTWSETYPTRFSTDHTMPYFGRLPDGRYFFIGDPYANNDARFPLTLCLSDDGYTFDKLYVLRDEPYEMRQGGWAKGGYFAYPEALIHGDHLYIFYSKQKEVMEITRVALKDIS